MLKSANLNVALGPFRLLMSRHFAYYWLGETWTRDPESNDHNVGIYLINLSLTNSIDLPATNTKIFSNPTSELALIDRSK